MSTRYYFLINLNGLTFNIYTMPKLLYQHFQALLHVQEPTEGGWPDAEVQGEPAHGAREAPAPLSCRNAKKEQSREKFCQKYSFFLFFKISSGYFPYKNVTICTEL